MSDNRGASIMNRFISSLRIVVILMGGLLGSARANSVEVRVDADKVLCRQSSERPGASRFQISIIDRTPSIFHRTLTYDLYFKRSFAYPPYAADMSWRTTISRAEAERKVKDLAIDDSTALHVHTVNGRWRVNVTVDGEHPRVAEFSVWDGVELQCNGTP